MENNEMNSGATENRNRWLADIGNNDELWADDLANVPAMICYSYSILRRLAREGNVYGVLLQIKDVYEYIMRIPTIMALIIIDNDPQAKDVEKYDNVIKALLGKPLSMGDWDDLAGKIVGKKSNDFALPESLAAIIRATRKLYTVEISRESRNVVRWRNDAIGHGFLKFEDDEAYQQEVSKLIDMLRQYFDGSRDATLSQLYSDLCFRIGGEEVRGNLFSYGLDNRELDMIAAGQEYKVNNYMYGQDLRFFLFNSYYPKKSLMKYSSYIDGLMVAKKNKYFDRLYASYVLRGSSNKAVSSGYISNEDEALLEYLHMPLTYIKPEYLIDELEDALDDLEHGIITIQMERGTGKSAFSNRMNGLYHGKPLIEDSFVRCYHIQHASLRGTSDFVNVLRDNFTHDFYGSRIVSSNDELRFLSLDTEDPAADMAEFLNYYHERYGKEYTMLILDGVDELTEETDKILDYIPCRDQLEEGVFVILTSRFADEESVRGRSRKNIERARALADREIAIRRKDSSNIDTLRACIKSYKKSGLINEGVDADALIRKSDYRFLYLKAYLELSEETGLETVSEEKFIESYILYISSHYSFIQNEQMIQIGTAIALFPGLSLERYQEYISTQDLTYDFIGVLNDLMPVLTVVYTDGENQYSFADAAYREYFLVNNRGTVLRIIQTIIDKICEDCDTIVHDDTWLYRSENIYDQGEKVFSSLQEQNRSLNNTASMLDMILSYAEENELGSVVLSRDNASCLDWLLDLYSLKTISFQCETLRYEILRKALRLSLQSLIHGSDIVLSEFFTLYKVFPEDFSYELLKIVNEPEISAEIIRATEAVATSEKEVSIIRATEAVATDEKAAENIKAILSIITSANIPAFTSILADNSLVNTAVDRLWELWISSFSIQRIMEEPDSGKEKQLNEEPESDREKQLIEVPAYDIEEQLIEDPFSIEIDRSNGENDIKRMYEKFEDAEYIWEMQRNNRTDIISRFLDFTREFACCSALTDANMRRIMCIRLVINTFILGDYSQGTEILENSSIDELADAANLNDLARNMLKWVYCEGGESIEEFINDKYIAYEEDVFRNAKQAIADRNYSDLTQLSMRVDIGKIGSGSQAYMDLLRLLADTYANGSPEGKSEIMDTTPNQIIVDAVNYYHDIMNIDAEEFYEPLWNSYIADARKETMYIDYSRQRKLAGILSRIYTEHKETDKCKQLWKEYILYFASKKELFEVPWMDEDYQRYRSVFSDENELYYCDRFTIFKLAGLALTGNVEEAERLIAAIDDTNRKLFDVFMSRELFGHDQYVFKMYYDHLSRMCRYKGTCIKYGLSPQGSGSEYIQRFADPFTEIVSELLQGMNALTSYNEIREMIRLAIAHYYLSRNYSSGVKVCKHFIEVIESRKASDESLANMCEKLIAFTEYSMIHLAYLNNEKSDTNENHPSVNGSDMRENHPSMNGSDMRENHPNMDDMIGNLEITDGNRVIYKGVSISDSFIDCDYVDSQIRFARDFAGEGVKDRTEYTHKITFPREEIVMNYRNKLF